MIQIHFFGRAADRIGSHLDLDLPETVTTVADLRGLIARNYPDAAGEIARPSLRACVGDEIVGEDHDIRQSDLIEFFPPLSGG